MQGSEGSENDRSVPVKPIRTLYIGQDLVELRNVFYHHLAAVMDSLS